MCYNIAGLTLRKLKQALRSHLPDEEIDKIREEYERLRTIYTENEDLYYASGFSFPYLCMIYKKDGNYTVDMGQWGLVPGWVKDEGTAKKLRTKTLNCRSETMFEKPSFKRAAASKRCIIMVDGFYEYFHHHKNKYPFLIEMKDDHQPLSLGALYDDWVDRETGEVKRTVTILTTKPNDVMEKIHNNPKRDEGRMPVIIHERDFDKWLDDAPIEEVKETAAQLTLPFGTNELKYRTVPKLLGKAGVGNSAESRMTFYYEALEELDWLKDLLADEKDE